MRATLTTHGPEPREKPFVPGLLGALAEPAFDRTVRLVARIFRVPCAFMVLSESDAGGPRASHGPDAAAIAQDPAFATGPLQRREGLVIPDTTDSALRDSAVVTGPPGVRFYAGVPLTSAHNGPLGTLAITDIRPRDFTADDLGLLEVLASGSVEQMELGRTTARIAAELEERKRADLSVRTSRDELEAQVHERSEALAEAESRYHSIFEHAVEGIYQVEPGGRFLSVNPAFAHLLGYASPAELLETVIDPTTLYVRPHERTEFEARLTRDGTINNREVEAYRSDGSCIWLSENAHSVRDGAGRVLRYEGTVEDITARRTAEEALHRAHEELEDRVHERTAELALLNGDLLAQVAERQHAEEAARRSESKFRTLLENAQDLISIFSPEGVLLYASPSLQHILGYQPDEMIGESLFDSHLHPDDCGATVQRLARPLRGEGTYLRSEVRLRHRDGSWRTLENISSPLPEDFPVVGIVVNSRDITERRRNEREVEARARQQTAVAELSRRALRGVDLTTFFEGTAELVARTLEVERCSVAEFLPGGGQMILRSGFGFPPGIVDQSIVENWHVQTPGEERPLLVPDLRKVLDYTRLPALAKPAISAISATVHDGARSYGALSALSTRAREFTPEEQVFLQTVADLLSTVIGSHRHQTALQEMEARYQRIAANTPGMVYQSIRHADGTGTVPFVSEGCRQIYGLDPARIRAQPSLLNDCIHPADRPHVFAALDASNAAMAPLKWEGRIVLPDGDVRWVTVRSRPELLPNGDIYRDGVVIDVTELKHAQEAMRAAKEEAERANDAKSEFLSRMSHELRTPLNAILGFGQLLEMDALTPIQSTSVEQILAGGRHLLDLVNEILDISRIETGDAEMHPEPIDLHEAVTATLRFVVPMAEQHGVRLARRDSGNRGAVVLADKGRLNQVLLNLFSNAIKYNHEGGRVWVGWRRRPDGKVRVAVTDTGPGMCATDVEQLFTPFQRLKAPERGITGTGIGLTITKALVEAMGGAVGVRSKLGRGSQFYFDLPEPASDAPAPALAGLFPDGKVFTSPTAPLPPLRTVLHIDDQAANLSLIERVLSARTDLRLLAATDGRSGLARAREELPDLILLDLHLPDLSGNEVVRRLHTEPRTRDIPVLVLSADATPGQIERLRSLGVRDYLTKPFKIGTLLRAVDAALNPPVEPV